MFRFIQSIKAQQMATRHNSQSNKLIHYLVSAKNWSINHDGECLMANLPLPIGELTTSHAGIKQGVFHFGGIADALSKGKMRWPSAEIPCGLTWFHILDNDKRLKLVPELDKKLSFWHSSCQRTIDTLIMHGANPDKAHVIPLGVDTGRFAPAADGEKLALRKRLNIDDDAIVIGSFQKDGSGWKNGRKPKMEKGPDVFCDVVETLAKTYKIFVLLSGPARGYVKSRLNKAGITFYHTGYLPHANDVAPFYKALDIYLISSRIEGGPKASLEATASGIPLVSTAVGMVTDIVCHGEQALVADVEDISALVRSCDSIINNIQLADMLAKNGRKLAMQYSWENVAQRYYEKLYLPLL